jgi:hypothetical protein
VRRLLFTAMEPSRRTTHPGTSIARLPYRAKVTDYCLAVGPGAVGRAITAEPGWPRLQQRVLRLCGAGELPSGRGKRRPFTRERQKGPARHRGTPSSIRRQFGTFGICGDCRCEVTENAMSQHLTRARLSRSVFGALVAMIAFTAALFSAAHHFAG